MSYAIGKLRLYRNGDDSGGETVIPARSCESIPSHLVHHSEQRGECGGSGKR